MNRTLASVSAAALCLIAGVANAQSVGDIMRRAAGEIASAASQPNAAPTPQRRSAVEEAVNPDLDTTARIENGRVCYDYLRIGGASTSVCVPLQNFADTVLASADMAALAFSGNSLAVTQATLATCYIPRGENPGLNARTLNDPSVSNQLNLTCPSAGRSGSTYELTILFNTEYYLPLKIIDIICGPDKSPVGSEFDRYVRSTLGTLESTDTRPCSDQTCVTAYYWLNNSSTLILKHGTNRQTSQCPNASRVQNDWTAQLMLNNDIGEPWLAHIEQVTQSQRNGSFTRF